MNHINNVSRGSFVFFWLWSDCGHSGLPLELLHYPADAMFSVHPSCFRRCWLNNTSKHYSMPITVIFDSQFIHRKDISVAPSSAVETIWAEKCNYYLLHGMSRWNIFFLRIIFSLTPTHFYDGRFFTSVYKESDCLDENSSDSIVEMACAIKILQFIQRYYRAIGIYAARSDQIGRPINGKNVLFVISIVPWIISLTAFLGFHEKNMLDFGISVFILISMIGTVFFYVIPMLQMNNTSKFIENCESFIEKSKYQL